MFMLLQIYHSSCSLIITLKGYKSRITVSYKVYLLVKYYMRDTTEMQSIIFFVLWFWIKGECYLLFLCATPPGSIEAFNLHLQTFDPSGVMRNCHLTAIITQPPQQLMLPHLQFSPPRPSRVFDFVRRGAKNLPSPTRQQSRT